MKKMFFCLILVFLLSIGTCFAETKEIIAEGTYIMGDGETPIIAEERATELALRSAIEQSGIYIESYSRTSNFQLTQNEINTIASGIFKVSFKKIDRKLLLNNSLEFKAMISGNIKPDDITALQQKIAQYRDQEQYKTYRNWRFGFSFNYPSEFIKGRSPANGDGLEFFSPDKKAIISVSGGNNHHNTLYNDYLDDINRIKGNITYKEIGSNWYALSWIDNGETVHYSKIYVGAKSSNALRIEYPVSQEIVYKPLIAYLVQSFREGDLSQGW